MYVNLDTKDIMPLICRLRIYKVQSSEKSVKSVWTQKEFSKGICSLKTFYTIEKGLTLPKEEMVNKFLAKLSEEFIYVPQLDEKILDYSFKIMNSVNYFRIDEIKKYLKKMTLILEPYKNYFYYKELFFIITKAYDYYINSKFMSRSEYLLFSNIYFVFNEQIEDLGKDIAFKYLHTIIDSIEYYIKQVSSLKLSNSHCITNQINNLVFNSYSNNDKILLDSFSDIEDKLIKSKNYIRCVDLYTLYLNALIVFSYDCVKDDFELTLNKVNSIMPKVKNQIKIAQFYLNISLIYVNTNIYDKAKEYLLECVKYKTIYQKYAFILYYYSTQRLNEVMTVNWNEIIKSIDETLHYSSKIDTAYNFFIMLINNNMSKDLQRFLIDEVTLYIKSDDKTFIKIFKYELMLLSQKSRKYSDLHKFYSLIGEE